MGNFGGQGNNLTASSTTVESKEITSFCYLDLVVRVQTIQHQKLESIKYLDEQCKNQKQLQNELKSRSLTLIDTYGIPIKRKYMDHESISAIVKGYKKNYVPKYLRQWVKIGRMNRNVISPLDESDLKLLVFECPDGCEFIMFGEMNILVSYSGDLSPVEVSLRVLVTDTIENVIIRLQKLHTLLNLELKLFPP
ncbi:unnamed protein product [Rotaria socialis]|uniref:Uncharacterized protein n=1 Tax=Rotaria socialis TaxID=392032 RepID=A0A821XCL4_9BILA|nr:unnamed protein product [Rotaria socialis]CAF4936440.1 unnamed protein product [Rotaria socialis]